MGSRCCLLSGGKQLRQWLGEIERVADTEDHQNQVAKITFPAKQYSGVYFDSMLQDWSHYKLFSMTDKF